MKYGIYSDIHANLEALKAVMNSMDGRGVERKVCLGDAVGYGPFPNECIKVIEQESAVAILGNHDSVALGRESSDQFNYFAKNAIEWTREVLSPESTDTMQKWPYLVEEPPVTFVHASPRSPADWTYIATLDEAVDAFSYFQQRICFIGHTHLPVIVIMEGEQAFYVSEKLHHKLEENQRILVNVGSVGQPRDGHTAASWCYCDTETLEVEIVRVPYDLQKTQKSMTERGFDDFLITRLAMGK